MQKPRGRGRTRIYKNESEKNKAYEIRNGVEDVRIFLKTKDSVLNKKLLKCAASEMGMSFSQFAIRAMEESISHYLGAEWIEGYKRHKENNP